MRCYVMMAVIVLELGIHLYLIKLTRLSFCSLISWILLFGI